jgi:hypothetical protein
VVTNAKYIRVWWPIVTVMLGVSDLSGMVFSFLRDSPPLR